MPIDPRHLVNPGQIAGLVARDADFDRRLRAVEAKQTVIGDGAISHSQLGEDSVQADNIAANVIQSDHIGANTIAAGHISANAIQAGHITAGAIQTGHLSANSITATAIAADAINAGHIQANAIQAGHIGANTISAGHISAESIQTGHIASGSVTSDKITVTSLSAITTNMGAITAGTITGGTLQTAASGSRVVMDSAGLRGFALDGVTKVFEINAGSGIASFTGVANLDSSSVVPGGSINGTVPSGSIPPIGGSNLLTNSSFENTTTPLDGWALYNNGLSPAPTLDVHTISTGLLSGTKVARLTNGTDTTGDMGIVNTTANRPNVVAGRKYTLSVYGAPSGSGGTFRVHIHWYNSSGTIIGSGNTGATATGVGNAWTRATVTATAPAGAVTAACYAWVVSPSSGFVFYFDGFQLEEGEVATAYAPRVNEILPGTVGTAELAANAITASKIAANTITAAQIAAGTISATELAANSVTALKIASGSIETNHITAGAVTASKITLDWGGSNILWDSGFEDNTTTPSMWVPSTATLTRPTNEIVPVHGDRVAKLTSTGTGVIFLQSSMAASVGLDTNTNTTPYGLASGYPGYYPLLKGKQYTFSYYVSSPAISRLALAGLQWFDGLRRQYLPNMSAPTVASTSGTGSLTTGTSYCWAVTAVNAKGETGIASFTTMTAPASGRVTVTAVTPTDAPGTDFPVTGIRIYRWVNGSAPNGYYEQPAAGGSSVQFTDSGGPFHVPGGSFPGSSTAMTVDTLRTDGTQVATEIPTSTPNAPGITSPTVVTGPFVITGAPAGTLWARWVRPSVTVTPPLGAAYCVPLIRIAGGSTGEVHYVDAAQLERGDIATGYARRAGEVLPGEVGATQITPNSITTNQIKSAGILADRLSVTQLSVITQNAGTITAGTITGVTITGGLIRTAAANARVEMDSGGMRFIDYWGSTGLTVTDGYITTSTNTSSSRFRIGNWGIDAYYGSTKTLNISNWGNISYYKGANGYPGMYFYLSDGGAQVGSIFQADWNSSTAKMTVRSMTSPSHTVAQADLVAHSQTWGGHPDTAYSQLGVTWGGGIDYVFARAAGGHYANILTNEQKSSFVQNGGKSRWTSRYGMYNQAYSGGWNLAGYTSAGVVWDFGAGNINFGDNPNEYIVDFYFNQNTAAGEAYMDWCSHCTGGMSGSTLTVWVANNHHTGNAKGALGLQVQGGNWA